jgi:hypothetical protein
MSRPYSGSVITELSAVATIEIFHGLWRGGGMDAKIARWLITGFGIVVGISEILQGILQILVYLHGGHA